MGRRSELFAYSVTSPGSPFAEREVDIAESPPACSVNILVLRRLWAETLQAFLDQQTSTDLPGQSGSGETRT